jgi:hypothetical protein
MTAQFQMTDWSLVKFFSPTEFNFPERMEARLIYNLDKLRKLAGKAIRINDSYRLNDNKQHGLGKAVDIVIEGMHWLDQYILVERSGLFTGIGAYPYWNTPGVHADIRDLLPGEPGARWARNAAGVYVSFDANFIRSALK